MSLIPKLDLANRLSVQAEIPAERTANLRDKETDAATVLDVEMEMVIYPDGGMGSQI